MLERQLDAFLAERDPVAIQGLGLVASFLQGRPCGGPWDTGAPVPGIDAEGQVALQLLARAFVLYHAALDPSTPGTAESLALSCSTVYIEMTKITWGVHWIIPRKIALLVLARTRYMVAQKSTSEVAESVLMLLDERSSSLLSSLSPQRPTFWDYVILAAAEQFSSKPVVRPLWFEASKRDALFHRLLAISSNA